MKAIVLAENLQKKLPFINHAVSPRNQLPILSNILLVTKNGKLQISSTDLEIGIQVEIPASIEEDGGITVPAKIFLDLISSLPSEKITLETKGESLEISSKNTKTSLQTIPQDEFPKLYEEKGEKIMAFKNNFKKDLSSIVFSASLDLGRPALSGVLVKKDAEGFSVVATDGYRLSLKKNEEIEGLKENLDNNLIIPARIIRELIGFKDLDGEVEVFISKEKNQILFRAGDMVLIGRLIEADFPNYQKIIPQDSASNISFDKEEMHKAVKICSIFARETANIVKLSLKKDKITVSANTPSIGENKVDIEAKLEGEENEIAFNAKYLLDFLSNVDDEEITFEMTGPLNPGVFKVKSNPNFLHLIMPIRVQG